MENGTDKIGLTSMDTIDLLQQDLHLTAEGQKQHIIIGWQMKYVELLIRSSVAKMIIKKYKNPTHWFKVIRTLNQHRKFRLGDRKNIKMALVDGKYYWGLYIPGWPSKAFIDFMEAEMHRVSPIQVKTNRFTNVFISVTNKCPLSCEHCSAWDELNRKERLSLPEIKTIVQKFQEKGTSQMYITGGEPLVRVDDVLSILAMAKKNTEFWVLTSGFNLTFENAVNLKMAGLTGVVISLDHFEPEKHNLFRGFQDSYEWVDKAVKNAIAANLVTALGICVTKSFVSEANLLKYMELAKRMGVSFVQILEPRAVGHYKEQDVNLEPKQEAILDAFYLKMNYNEAFKEYPLITYHGYHQRRIGCLGSGNRFLHIDTVGDLHACPFCQTKTGNALDANLDASIEHLQSVGCHKFKGTTI